MFLFLSALKKRVSDISKKQLESMRNLEDVLQRVPGIQVQKNSGLGGYSKLSFQGSNGKQIKVYLDGVLLNRDGEAEVDVSKIPVQILSRVEVDPLGLGHASSSLFGSGSLSIYLYTLSYGKKEIFTLKERNWKWFGVCFRWEFLDYGSGVINIRFLGIINPLPLFGNLQLLAEGRE